MQAARLSGETVPSRRVRWRPSEPDDQVRAVQRAATPQLQLLPGGNLLPVQPDSGGALAPALHDEGGVDHRRTFADLQGQGQRGAEIVRRAAQE
jgi:hypothetical protein